MKIKKLILTIAVFAISCVTACAETPQLKAHKVQSVGNAQQKIDIGNMQISTDSAFMVGIEISPEALKVQVEIASGPMRHRVIREGLRVYVDLSGKKKEKYYVQFPKQGFDFGAEMPQFAEGQESQIRPKKEDLALTVAKLSLEPVSFYQNKEEGMLAAENASISLVDENLVYVCIVPISSLGNKIEKEGKYSIGIATPKMEMPKMEGQGGRPMGGPGGPGGGGPGGGFHGGPGGPGGGMGGGRPHIQPDGEGSFPTRGNSLKEWFTVAN